jgi:N-acetylmuramoyl-L-alanine amidase
MKKRRTKMSKKVAVMCGHGRSLDGSWDSGTTYKSDTEADLMLPITKYAVKYLRTSGLKVITDADSGNNKNMKADVSWANKEGCAVYVSLHCDWYKANSGVMPLYVSKKGKKLATALNNTIKKGMPMKSRGVIRRKDLYELNATSMPACILETGSIKADRSTLKKEYKKYGKLIAKGICKYLGVEFKTKKAEPKKTVTASKDDTASPSVTAASAKKTGAQKIVAKAKEYCYPYKTKRKKWDYKTGKARSAYKKALKKYFGKKAKISQSDCGYFVGTCVRAAGVSKKFKALPGSAKEKYPKVPSGMKIVLKGKKIPKGFLKPGDIIRYRKKNGHQHTLMCYSKGKIAEAGRGHWFPAIKKDTKKYNKSSVKKSSIQVLRAK